MQTAVSSLRERQSAGCPLQIFNHPKMDFKRKIYVKFETTNRLFNFAPAVELHTNPRCVFPCLFLMVAAGMLSYDGVDQTKALEAARCWGTNGYQKWRSLSKVWRDRRKSDSPTILMEGPQKSSTIFPDSSWHLKLPKKNSEKLLWIHSLHRHTLVDTTQLDVWLFLSAGEAEKWSSQ